MSMNVRFYSSSDINISLKSHFWPEKFNVLSLLTQHCYGRHDILYINMQTASGLSILHIVYHSQTGQMYIYSNALVFKNL